MKVNEEKIRMIASVMRSERYECNSRAFEIEMIGGIGSSELKLGVNWSACGTKTAEETLKFAMNLMKVTELVTMINALNAEVYWTREPMYKSKEEYEEDVEKLSQMVHDFDTIGIVNWICR